MYSGCAALFCVLALAACFDDPEAVAFSDTDGVAEGVSDCICSYGDGSEGDAYIELTCTGGNSTFDSMSLFLDPSTPGTEQGITLLFQPSSVAGTYKAGGTGQFGTLGEERRPDDAKDQIIRSIDGIDLRWTTQDACDAAYGCEATPFHLLAGGMHRGTGGCEDFWASVAQAGG